MIEINIKSGRDDVGDFFRKSGIREYKKLQHTPFVVIASSDNGVDVDIVDSAKKLLQFPDNTPVLAQWRGEYRSDFFKFTVGQFRKYCEENPPASYMIV